MENCKSCFRVCDPIPDCLTSLSVITSVLSDEILVQIIDKFDNIYISEITTEVNGLAILDLQNIEIFPVGLINQWSGEFKLVINKDDEIVPFTVGNKSYDCLIFEAKTTFPKETTYTIDVYGNESGGY